MITLEQILRTAVKVQVSQLVERLIELGEDIQFSNQMDAIYEYWLVSYWLAEEIKSGGGCVTEYLDLYIWGRTETGQSLTLDSTLNEICKRVNAS